MKGPLFQGLRNFLSLLRDGFIGTGRNIRSHWLWGLLVFTLIAVSAWIFIQPMDDIWMTSLRDGGKPSPQKKAIAEWIGSTGDALGFNLTAFGLLWLTGFLTKKTFWKRVAVASLVGMIVAGLLCNILRPTLGRPRPSTQSKQKVEDTLAFGRGWVQGHPYQSFPSAHTATAFGTATAVLIACPPAGAPLMIFAGGMAWARIVQNSHHPSDVLAGATLGILIGIAAGRWARKSHANSPS